MAKTSLNSPFPKAKTPKTSQMENPSSSSKTLEAENFQETTMMVEERKNGVTKERCKKKKTDWRR